MVIETDSEDEYNPQDYWVEATIRVKVYADDKLDAQREVNSYRNWLDWELGEVTKVEPDAVSET